MNKAIAIAVGVLLLVLLVVFMTTYSVRFNEVAVRTTFGKTSTASVVSEPGVHFKIPLFADRIRTYDTRIQLSETPLIEVPTADGQSVVVKTFLMWKIDLDEVETFAGSFRQSSEADMALRGLLQTAVKSGLSRYRFDDLVGADSRLEQAERDIQAQLQTNTTGMGIDPVTVGISQIQLPSKTTKAVLERMQATRQRLAETERSKGTSEAAGIQANANTVVDNLKAFAEQRAEEIRGMAQNRAADYLRRMNENVELATFLVRLDTLKKTLGEYVTVVLSDEASPFHLLNQVNGTAAILRPAVRAPEPDDEATEDEAADELARRGS
jgi:membrane protease subunit HflC